LRLTYCCNISDEGLVSLKGLTKLCNLELNFCNKITQSGIKYIENACPLLRDIKYNTQ